MAQNVFLFVDVLRRILPKWLTERPTFKNAFRYLYTMVSRLDAGMEILVQLTNARYPGVGTPTALPLIGQSRGLIRGLADTNTSYALYLRQWLTLWKHAGQQAALAKAISHYCGNVKVRSVNRAGTMVTVDTDGSVTTEYGVAWDWDSKSNTDYEASIGLLPAARWSELWIIVYTPPWVVRANWGSGNILGSDPDKGIGHLVPRVDRDAIQGLLADWKRNSSRIVCIIFTYNAANFDPLTPATMPDGYFGKWGRPDPNIPSRRIRSRFTDCRYWEPNGYFIGGPHP